MNESKDRAATMQQQVNRVLFAQSLVAHHKEQAAKYRQERRRLLGVRGSPEDVKFAAWESEAERLARAWQRDADELAGGL